MEWLFDQSELKILFLFFRTWSRTWSTRWRIIVISFRSLKLTVAPPVLALVYSEIHFCFFLPFWCNVNIFVDPTRWTSSPRRWPPSPVIGFSWVLPSTRAVRSPEPPIHRERPGRFRTSGSPSSRRLSWPLNRDRPRHEHPADARKAARLRSSSSGSTLCSSRPRSGWWPPRSLSSWPSPSGTWGEQVPPFSM